jgi:hypothetical protein
MNARLNGSDAFSPADGLELEHRKRWSTSKLQVAIFYSKRPTSRQERDQSGGQNRISVKSVTLISLRIGASRKTDPSKAV